MSQPTDSVSYEETTKHNRNVLSMNNLINHEEDDVNTTPAQPELAKDTNGVQEGDAVPDDETDTDNEIAAKAAQQEKTEGVENDKEDAGVTFGNFDFDYDAEDSEEESEEENRLEEKNEQQQEKVDKVDKEEQVMEEETDSDDDMEKELAEEIQGSSNSEKEKEKVGVKIEEKEQLEEDEEDKSERIPLKRSANLEDNDDSSVAKKTKKSGVTAASSTIVEDFESKPLAKTTVKEDLESLAALNNVAKPVKYNITPVWARKWQPTTKAGGAANVNGVQGGSGSAAGGNPSVTEGSHGFPPFQASFNNVIPDDDITKSIQEWIYATILSIPEEERQFIELEMKFGILTGENQVDRINPPISTQSIYTDIDGHLLPNIDENLFRELVKYFNDQQQQFEQDNLPGFSVIESHNVDSVYRLNDFYNHRRPRFLRLSKDYDTGRVAQFVEKKSISHLLIYSPKDSYDLKISMNLELPLNTNDEPPEKFEHETPIHTRNKKRVSFIHHNSFTRFDLTHVVSKNGSVNERGEKEGKNVNSTFEVELEVNVPMLLKSFEFITTDSTKYANLIRSYLNNGTLIRRKMSQLSVEIFEGKKKL